MFFFLMYLHSSQASPPVCALDHFFHHIVMPHIVSSFADACTPDHHLSPPLEVRARCLDASLHQRINAHIIHLGSSIIITSSIASSPDTLLTPATDWFIYAPHTATCWSSSHSATTTPARKSKLRVLYL
ncbi:hypothetical protein F5148DRAFT_933312 [Russula earlei]|uniref:Uncharacterized protein n=1 Tax=Russula earlei TaxID=71964 RepID=A0ACC0U958_9AGAM|nr:hypothetical protein F5148DRAFT_933312 [Russula earlei]